MGIAMSLAALCLGYLVFIQGSREIGNTRTVGRLIGITTIILAVACLAWGSMKCSLMRGGCPLSKGMCKMSMAKK